MSRSDALNYRTGTGIELHPAFTGSAKNYQRAALQRYAAHKDTRLSPWSLVQTVCGQPLCMRVDCMEIRQPVTIQYPSGVCVYCGDPAGTKDHLLPRAWTGDSGQRNRVAVVPACADCNGRINDSLAVSITERRQVAHERIARKHRQLLSVQDRTEAEIAEFGYVMQTVIRKNIAKREWVRARLAWPTDPDYDLRAFGLSGIADPETLGLL